MAGDMIADTDGDTMIQVEESADEDKIRFDTLGSERMIIDETGKVGIGLTGASVTNILTVDSAGALGAAAGITLDGDTNNPWIYSPAAGGLNLGFVGKPDLLNLAYTGITTIRDAFIVDDEDGQGIIHVYPNASDSLSNLYLHTNVVGSDDHWRILAWGDAHATTQYRRDMLFQNSTNGTATNVLYLARDGRMGVGRMNPTYAVDLANSADAFGRGIANAWNTYSDGRFKTEVEPIEGALDKLMKIEGITYRSMEGKKPEENTREMGFIAQEVNKVFPEAVDVEPNSITIGTEEKEIEDYHSLSYDRLTAAIVEAVKELNTKVLGVEQNAKTALEKSSQAATSTNAGLDSKRLENILKGLIWSVAFLMCAVSILGIRHWQLVKKLQQKDA